MDAKLSRGPAAKVRRAVCALAGVFAGVATAASKPTTMPAVTPPPATAPSGTVDPARINRWIDDLQGDHWRAAADALVAAGDAAEPKLRALNNSDFQDRLGTVLRRIEESRAVAPTRITLHLHDVEPAEVFAELARQSHTQFMANPADPAAKASPKVSVDLDDQPFWEATRRVFKRIPGYRVQIFHGNDTVFLGTGEETLGGPAVVSGPFLVIADAIHKSSFSDLKHPQNDKRCDISFRVFVDPRVTVLESQVTAELLEARDENGQSMATRYTPSRNENIPRMELPVSAGLKYQNDGGKRLAVLKGRIHCVVATRTESIELTDLANVHDLTLTLSGRRVLIKRAAAEPGSNRFAVETVAYRDDLSASQWDWFTRSQVRTSLLDPQGRALYVNGWNGTPTDTQSPRTLLFALSGKPARWRWEIPVEWKEIAIPFQFEDLALP